MNVPMVAIAVSSTMLTSPISAAPPKMVPLETNSPPPAGAGQQVADVAVQLAPTRPCRRAPGIGTPRRSSTKNSATRQQQRHLQGAPRIDVADLHGGPHRATGADWRPARRGGRDGGPVRRLRAGLAGLRGLGPDGSGTRWRTPRRCGPPRPSHLRPGHLGAFGPRLGQAAAAPARAGRRGPRRSGSGAAVPVMNRLTLASMLEPAGGAAAGRASGRAGVSAGRGGVARAGPRRAAAARAARRRRCGGGRSRAGSPRSTEPLPVAGPSPGPG